MNNPIKEQQTKPFPTGEWKFGRLDIESQEHIIDNVSERQFGVMFTYWDKNGYSYLIYKILGITPDSIIATYCLKRWLQFTSNPVNVKVTYDCNELHSLFDQNSDGADHITDYLCNNATSDNWYEDWYYAEWDTTSSLSEVDDENMLTLSKILGVSEDSIENIMNFQGQTEDEDRFIEENETLIGNLRQDVLTAQSNEEQVNMLRDIHGGIDDALTSHFGHGFMVRDGHVISWVIEDDLRNWVQNNDAWDNNNFFEFGPEHIGNTIEEVLMELYPSYVTPNVLFGMVMNEEYMFDDYGDGKLGETLINQTDAFNRYYYPTINSKYFNEMLGDSLAEYDWKTGELVSEECEIKRWNKLGNLDKARILEHGPGPIKRSRNVDIPEYVRSLLTKAIFETKGGWGRPPTKFILYMRRDGEIVDVRGSASFTTTPKEFTVGNKATLSNLINYERTSNYTLTMDGNISEGEMVVGKVAHIVKKEAGLTAQRQFYLKRLSEDTNSKSMEELLNIRDSMEITSVGWSGAEGRKSVMDFLFKLRDSGLVNMFQSPDFLISGSRWFKKYVDFKHPELLEDYDEYMDEEDDDYDPNQKRKLVQELINDADKVRDVMIGNVMGRRGDNASLSILNSELRPASVDMVRLFMLFTR